MDAIAAAMTGAKFEAVASDNVVLEMWEKWVFLASLAGITCLTRSAVGDVVAAGGADLAASLLEECLAIATAAGYAPRPDSLKASRARLTDPNSAVTASMLGDVERKGRTEADHILGDLLRRRGTAAGEDRSLLRVAHIAVKAAGRAGGAGGGRPSVVTETATAERGTRPYCTCKLHWRDGASDNAFCGVTRGPAS